jgi:hypothetical protein
MTFRVGQKVVCISEDKTRILRRGRIYTIASIRWIGADETNDPGLGVTVEETPTKEDDEWFAEFRAERFRPIVERKTDISIFTKMLTGERIDA